MTEEEKKAIELMEICMYGTEESTIIKNLIDKQQKEIENWKKTAIEFSNEREKLLKTPVISKDKIREKIEYIEKNYSEFAEYSINKSIEFLQELLDEN